MKKELEKMLKAQLDEDRKTLVKLDAGSMTPQELGYNPKLISDERALIEQLLYLQEVKAEIASNQQAVAPVQNA